jgi:plasmid replication initiation protein
VGTHTNTEEQLSLVLDSPLVGKVKNNRKVMFWNFFALSKDRVTELPVYDDGRVRIEVTGTKHGVANIYDKDVLIYLVSLMQDKLNRGEPVERRFTFTIHDFCRVVGIASSGTAYSRIEDALRRLQGTQIRTNIETGGQGSDAAFSWVGDYNINYRRGKDGEKVMKSVTVDLCEWLYRAVLRDGNMLTHPVAYFKLSPMELRLYEIARSGPQDGFRMNLEKLRIKVGSSGDLKEFKRRIAALTKLRNPIPEYGIALVDPRAQRTLDAKAPPSRGRTSLKAYQVYFFRTDRMASMAPWHQAKVADDFPESDDL